MITWTDNKGHVWAKDDTGEIDIFAYSEGRFHNGPKCERCGYGFCHHCNAEPEQECTVRT